MTPAKKLISNSGEPMLSARAAAKILSCAPDYIGRLCREGEIEGERINGAWYVSQQSLGAFKQERIFKAQRRAQELSRLRREENEQYRQSTGQSPAPRRSAASTVSFWARMTMRQIAIVGITAVFLLGSSALLASGRGASPRTLPANVATSAAAVPDVSTPATTSPEQQAQLAAALAQVDSPFFATRTSQTLFAPIGGLRNFFAAVLAAVGHTVGHFATWATGGDTSAPVADAHPASGSTTNNYTTNIPTTQTTRPLTQRQHLQRQQRYLGGRHGRYHGGHTQRQAA